MKNTIDINQIRKLLPSGSALNIKAGTNHIEINFMVRMADPYFELVKEKITRICKKHLMEIFTEETGRWFFVYLRKTCKIVDTMEFKQSLPFCVEHPKMYA